jgi:hypothetical protein
MELVCLLVTGSAITLTLYSNVVLNGMYSFEGRDKEPWK